MTQSTTPPRLVSPIAKLALKAQVFLLRRNWMGSAGNIIMVITTTGRKSGKPFSTPIGYQMDGETVIAFNVRGASNWYKNLANNPIVRLEIKRKPRQMQAKYVTEIPEIRQILELYQREQPNMLPRFFGVASEAKGDELMKAAETVKFVRFSPV